MLTVPVIETGNYIIHKVSNYNLQKSSNFFVHLKNIVISDIKLHGFPYSVILQMNHFGKLPEVKNIRAALSKSYRQVLVETLLQQLGMKMLPHSYFH